MAKAGDKGILLGDYIKLHEQPETLVRGQLDRIELRYTWKDSNGNLRASDDGGELPPKGWWTRPEFTKIDYEQHSVWGYAHIPPSFPPMYFVKVYPVVTPNHTPRKARPRGRPSSAHLVVAEAIDRLQSKQRAEIERGGLARFLEALRSWLSKDHPQVRQIKCKTIGDHLRNDEKIQAVWPKTWRRRRR